MKLWSYSGFLFPVCLLEKSQYQLIYILVIVSVMVSRLFSTKTSFGCRENTSKRPHRTVFGFLFLAFFCYYYIIDGFMCWLSKQLLSKAVLFLSYFMDKSHKSNKMSSWREERRDSLASGLSNIFFYYLNFTFSLCESFWSPMTMYKTLFLEPFFIGFPFAIISNLPPKNDRV